MRYAVVIEKAQRNYSAYVPDVPGCITTGKTVHETLINLREALSLHFAGMRENADPIPDPTTFVDYIDLDIDSGNDLLTTGKRLKRADKGRLQPTALRSRAPSGKIAGRQ